MISLSLGVTGRLMSSGFNPVTLFANNEPGWVYDNSDMSTLFQDSAGTTPVTAVGQPVGLQLDKSKGLVLGPELVTNGDFSAGSTGWTVPAGWTITGGVAVATATSDSLRGGGVNPVLGRGYRVEFDVISYTSGVLYITVGGNFTGRGSLTGSGMSPGRKSIIVISGSDSARGVEFYGGAISATIDNISVKELAGTHRYQTTINYRPTFARLPVTGRRNLLTYTEQFDNAVWSKTALSGVTPNTIAGPNGEITADKLVEDATYSVHRVFYVATVTASTTYTASVYVKAAERFQVRLMETSLGGANFDLSTGVVSGQDAGVVGTITPVGDGWYRCTITALTGAAQTNFVFQIQMGDAAPSFSSYQGNGVSGLFVAGAQLEKSAAATNYQAVASIYDITEAGVQTAYGLYYDGQDDFLVTPTITPGTDKVQVFAGVRKLSDAADAVVAHLGDPSASNNGSLRIDAPGSGTAAKYQFVSRGTITVIPFTTSAVFSAPKSNVVTGLGDISGDRATLRVNGTQVHQLTSDQGTGDYLANPVYFGRRGGTTLPFNGYTFREVGRFGPNLDAATIANTEAWINQNTGAY